MPSYLSRIPVRWRKAGLAFAVVCVSTAMIMLPGRPSPADDETGVETVIAAAEAAPPVATTPAPRPRAPRPAAPRPAASPKPAVSPTPAVAPSVAARNDPTPAQEVAAVAAAAQGQSEPATIVGCLEFDDDTYRLTDTDGEDAPKARSWKSGFLRRSNARLDVTDAADRLRLATHVGHRVSLTGTLLEREMQARSLKMVANTCDD